MNLLFFLILALPFIMIITYTVISGRRMNIGTIVAMVVMMTIAFTVLDTTFEEFGRISLFNVTINNNPDIEQISEDFEYDYEIVKVNETKIENKTEQKYNNPDLLSDDILNLEDY